MEQNTKDTIEGWNLDLMRNVHMYAHALTVQKGNYKFSINCEDLVTKEKTIGIWLYNSDIPEKLINDIKNILLIWAKKQSVIIKIYSSKNEFVTNG